MAIRVSLFLFLCFSFQVHSQVAERPDVRVGDKWLFERFDLIKKEVTGTREWRITEMSGEAVKLEGKDSASGNVETRVTDLEGNPVEIGGRKFDPKLVLHSFPLSLGKKWSNKVVFPNEDGTGTVTEDRTCEVLSLEDVSTKAGAFKAYKINCEGAYVFQHNIHRVPMSGRSFSVLWYAPEAKLAIRHEHKRSSPRGGWIAQYVDQLVSLELRK